jgi:hypothetical protein
MATLPDNLFYADDARAENTEFKLWYLIFFEYVTRELSTSDSNVI